MMKQHYSMFAGYNRWANERLYEAAAKLPDDDYRADRGAFFGSLHRTLNHLVVTDRIWLRRFTGAGPAQARLDEIVHDDLPELAVARAVEDERIIGYIESLTDADLAATFSYQRASVATTITQPLSPAIAHMFNHQTHHRGQAHVLLTIAGGRDFAPSFDLVEFQRATGIGLG
ncbi:MAG: DinB family protein [Bauldia sp.]